MIYQLKAIIDFQDIEEVKSEIENKKEDSKEDEESKLDKDVLDDVLKTRIKYLHTGQAQRVARRRARPQADRALAGKNAGID